MKTKGAQVDAFSPVMNGCGDKLGVYTKVWGKGRFLVFGSV
jgi:hypothetical protein